jgi:uncharacterized protein (TIGR02246 family)
MMASDANIRSAIAAANKSFMAMFGAGDAAGMAKAYTANGMLLPPQSDFVTGSAAIQAFWQGAMDMGLKDVKLATAELEVLGDTAIEVGKYTLSLVNGQVADAGKYVVIWKNDGGSWKLHRDMWNTSKTPG